VIALSLLASLVAAGYIVHLRRTAVARAELWRTLGQTVPLIRTTLRTAHMLPLHDIRPARQQVRALIQDVEQKLQGPLGRDAGALGAYVLGEGYLALGDDDRALQSLQAAWSAGQRGPDIDSALGQALGAVYEHKLETAKGTLKAPERDTRIAELEKQYRDPALAHLRNAVGAGDVPAGYLEAVALFHEIRLPEAIERAHAAFAQAPMFYEAGDLEARAHHYLAEDLHRAGKNDEAKRHYEEARRLYRHVREIARSDDRVCVYQAVAIFNEIWLSGVSAIDPALAQELLGAYEDARQINPDDNGIPLREARFYNLQAGVALDSGKDAKPAIAKSLALANAVIARDPENALAFNTLCQVLQHQTELDEEEKSAQQTIEACRTAVRLKSTMDRLNDLGNAYSTLAGLQARRGADATGAFELAAKSYRDALAIADGATMHHNLGDLYREWARTELDHGRDPRPQIEHALAEFKAALAINKNLSYSEGAACATLVLRARYELERGDDPRPTAATALAACQRCLAINPGHLDSLIKQIAVHRLEAEYRAAHDLDPTAALAQARAAARAAVKQDPTDHRSHLEWSQAEAIAARWSARHGSPDAALARATAEAALALAAHPKDPEVLTVSADVDRARAEAERARSNAAATAIARGLATVGRALAIDPQFVRGRTVRDALVRLVETSERPERRLQ
jgi:serine/threonine-protein kinase